MKKEETKKCLEMCLLAKHILYSVYDLTFPVAFGVDFKRGDLIKNSNVCSFNYEDGARSKEVSANKSVKCTSSISACPKN